MLFNLLWITCLVSLIIIVHSIFMIIRNNWVYRKRSNHIDIVYRHLQNIKGSKYEIKPEKYKLPKIRNIFKSDMEYYECLWDYDRMLTHFWIWDVSKMVRDRKCFDEIYGQGDKN